jgi:MFS family permease
MTAVLGTQDREGGERLASPRRLVFQAAAALAMSMGIGRFAYTPILPLMHGRAGLSPQEGSALAVANYIGYLVGAILTTVVPGLARSRSALRAGLVVVIASVALMAPPESQAAWLTLRLAAGIASSGLTSAVLFGATLLGVAAMVLTLGARFSYPQAIALLTAGYSIGQVLGPLIVTPLLHDGYRVALLAGAAIIFAAAIAAGGLRTSLPAGSRARLTGARRRLLS